MTHIKVGSQLLAGISGLDRMITWAHAVDTDEPWLWVEPGDLMMTTGTNLPVDDPGQREWIRLLDASRVAGILIEIPKEGLTLTDGLLQVANERGLPLISAERPILFNKISHLVVESALRSQWERTEMVQRLFSSYTSNLQRGTGSLERLQRLCRVLNAEVKIMQEFTNSVIYHYKPENMKNIRDHWLAIELPGQGRETAHLKTDSRELIQDEDFMWHWSTLVAMELGFEKVQLDQVRHQGAPILRALINGKIESTTIAPILEQQGLKGDTHIVALDTVDPDVDRQDYFARLHLIPGLREEPHLICEMDGVLYLAIGYPLSQDLLTRLGTHKNVIAGLSRPISASNTYPEAANQALNALHFARSTPPGAVDFRDFIEQSIGIFDRETARHRIEAVLGPLKRHDDKNGTELLRTLTTYLEVDRAGTRTAGLLVIHRQTLVYRLKMIERLTGIDPNSTDGIVAFHQAITASKHLHPRAGRH